MSIEKLKALIIQKIREGETDFSFGLTLPCGCCGETRHFYIEEEEVDKKSDDELLDFFETDTEVFFTHVVSWYENGSYLQINLND